MAREGITPVYNCAECGKTTARLLGFAALVNLVDDAGERASRHVAVLGTCAAHREQMPGRFADEAAARGEVAWLCDEPAELRPAEVPDWYASVDRLIAEAAIRSGVMPPEAHIPVSSSSEVPRSCPHCGGTLSWGTGPHVADAAARGNAMAWECLSCRAAGILG